MSNEELPGCSRRDCDRAASAVVEGTTLCARHADELIEARQDHSSLSWVARAQRHGVELPIFAYTCDGRRVPALMTDLSYDGCQLKVHDAFATGELVGLVQAQVGEITGRVKWAREGSVGIEFVP